MMSSQPKWGRRGYTLNELLTVIAILALLIAILLPSIKGVRDQSRKVVCSSRIRETCRGMLLYAELYDEAIVGSPATSGSYFVSEPGDGYEMQENDTPTIGDATQVFDYAGPILRVWNKTWNPKKLLIDQFNDIRRRDEFSCPSNRFTSVSWIPQIAAAAENIDAGAGPMVSYNTSRSFMFVGLRTEGVWGRPIVEFPSARWHGNPVIRSREMAHNGRGIGYSWQLFEDGAPEWYLPNLRYIGNPSQKVFIADGARYTYLSTKPDYDLRYYADWGGCFADGSPYLTLSRSWSREQGPGNGSTLLNARPPVDPRQYSYRHGNGQAYGPWGQFKMNVGFFDGHVELMDDVESANPHMWLPKGGKCEINQTFGGSKISRDVQRIYGSIPMGGIR